MLRVVRRYAFVLQGTVERVVSLEDDGSLALAGYRCELLEFRQEQVGTSGQNHVVAVYDYQIVVGLQTGSVLVQQLELQPVPERGALVVLGALLCGLV